MVQYPLYLGCTKAVHDRIGIHAVVNARGGLQHLNQPTIEDIELKRDAQKIRDWQAKRVRFYQFNSRFFRRHINRVQHLLSSYSDF